MQQGAHEKTPVVAGVCALNSAYQPAGLRVVFVFAAH
jgi:hypothetical protein